MASEIRATVSHPLQYGGFIPHRQSRLSSFLLTLPLSRCVSASLSFFLVRWCTLTHRLPITLAHFNSLLRSNGRSPASTTPVRAFKPACCLKLTHKFWSLSVACTSCICTGCHRQIRFEIRVKHLCDLDWKSLVMRLDSLTTTFLQLLHSYLKDCCFTEAFRCCVWNKHGTFKCSVSLMINAN